MSKKTLSKVLSLILSLLMILGSIPVLNVFANTTLDGLVYTLSSGSVTINDYLGTAKDLYIPSEINGYPVRIIGQSAFFQRTDLTSITIPESVTGIGNYAFVECTSLVAINVDANNKNYTSIDGVLFDKNLKKIICCPSEKTFSTTYDIPTSVNYIGDYAFYKCTNLTSITFPEGVETIGSDAFYGCLNLSSVNIPESVKTIGSYAFCFCPGIASVTIPSGVTSIGELAFLDCATLTAINVDADNKYYTSIDGVLFDKNIKKLICCPGGKAFSTTYTIPESVTRIDYYAFAGCTGMDTVTIPESVTSIGTYAFAWCTGVDTITIPASVTKIGKDAFTGIGSILYCGFPDQWDRIRYTLSAGQKVYFENFTIEITKLPEKTEYLQGETFDPTGMVITATIDGESKVITDYTYNSAVGMDPGKKQIELNYYGVTITVDIVVKEKTIQSISISQMPYKVVYMQGETFEPDGIELTVEYTDGTTYKTSKCTMVDTKTTEAGTKSVTVVYNGKYTSFDILVLPRAIDGIEITKLPDKVAYNLGEKLDTTGMIVIANYENGDVGTTTDYDVSYNTDVVGKTDVTVTFMGKSATFSIDVIDPDEPPASEPPTSEPEGTDSTEPSTSEPEGTDSTEPSTSEPEGTDFTEPSTTEPDETDPTASESTPNMNEGLLGDVNGDGVVNVKDATAIQKHIAGLITLSESQLVLADYNLDQAVNIKDATTIQKKIAGLI